MGIGAGDLDKRIRIEIADVSESALGGEVETWRLLGHRWARVRFGKAEERRAAAAEGSSQTALFVIRKDRLTGALQTRDRVTWGGWIWDIEGAVPFGDEFIELACVARTEEEKR